MSCVRQCFRSSQEIYSLLRRFEGQAGLSLSAAAMILVSNQVQRGSIGPYKARSPPMLALDQIKIIGSGQ